MENRSGIRPSVPEASENEDEYAPQHGNKNRTPARGAASRVTAGASKKKATTAKPTTAMMDLTGDDEDMQPPSKAPTARGGRGVSRGRGSRGGGRGNKAVTPTKTPLNISV